MKTICVDKMHDVSEALWRLDYRQWFIYSDFYGNATRVEADFTVLQEKFAFGLALNISFDGGYACQVDRRYGQPRLLLLKNEYSTACLKCINLGEFGMDLQKDKKYQLALELECETVKVFLDEKELISFDVHGFEKIFTQGECGYTFRYPGCVDIHDIKIVGEELQRPKAPEVILPDPYIYELNLDGAYELPDEWTKMAGATPFTVKNGKMVSEKEKYCESLIYQFDNNPTITAKFSVEEIRSDSEFGFVLRKAPRTAYLKLGYKKGRWYLQDVPALYDSEVRTFNGEPVEIKPDKEYTVEIFAKGENVKVIQDGNVVLSAEGLRLVGYGRTGVFSDNIVLSVNDLTMVFESGVAPTREAFSYCVECDKIQTSMEIEITDDKKLIGISKKMLHCSVDGGDSFQKAPEEYAGVDPKGYYQSVIRLHDGKYLQVMLHKGGEIQISDDLIHWKPISRFLPDDLVEHAVSQKLMTHISSITEIQKPDGSYRIFLPVQLNTYIREIEDFPLRGHDASLFYSDDGGYTWNSTDWIAPKLKKYHGDFFADWSESKIINCADGTLRMYCSRNNSHYFSFFESYDFGETWCNLSVVPQMQCARSSFATVADPVDKNTWYVVWVNGKYLLPGYLCSRARLSLARTRDGKNWEFLCDVERFGEQVGEVSPIGSHPLFQVIDPTINADDEYLYISWGCALMASRADENTVRVMNDPSSLAPIHNEVRPMFARIKKDKLQVQPWTAATVADLSKLEYDLTNEKW